MGLWSTVLLATVLALGSPQARAQVRVEGFDLAVHGLAFANYRQWSESRLPEWAQLAHCTSLVLMVRQMFHYARFAPDQPRLSDEETERRIRAIYRKSATRPPEGVDRITIPGFANLRELSASSTHAAILRRTMGDAVFDAARPGWHWTPLDILRIDQDSNERMEQYLRDTLDRGRVAMLYLARGTNLAHALLVFGYEEVPGQRRYATYDPNRPSGPTAVTYNPSTRDFYHPTLHNREGWILHPYEDMAEPPYPGWF